MDPYQNDFIISFQQGGNSSSKTQLFNSLTDATKNTGAHHT